MPVFLEALNAPSAQDLSDLHKVYGDWYRQSDSPTDDGAIQAEIAATLSATTATLYGARFNGRLIAVVTVIHATTTCWQLEKLCVRQLTRRRGVASKLLLDLQSLAKAQHAALRLNSVDTRCVEAHAIEERQALEGLMHKLHFNKDNSGHYHWQSTAQDKPGD